jgi:3-oxoacyl-[acyl-carrier-protein] synthase II
MGSVRPDIAITGAGVVSAVGTGCEALCAALASGRDGLRAVQRFPVAEFTTGLAGLWPGWDGRAPPAPLPEGGLKAAFSALEMAREAAAEAWANARGASAAVPPGRVAVVLGTCFGERLVHFSELTEGVAASIGAAGPCVTVSTACSSSTTAVGLGRDLIEEGEADLVLAGGADVLTREIFAGFHALGALSTTKCTPFGAEVGTTLGEGAGFVVLEAEDRARARGAAPLGYVLGHAVSGDAHHETAPDPSGAGVARAIRWALDDAQLPPDAVGCVSAHGTGTAANDVAEWAGIQIALGEAAARVPVTASKCFLGHAQGAAGILELLAVLLGARQGFIPPTLRASPRRPKSPPGLVADLPRGPDGRRAGETTGATLKISAAFGGANAALVVGSAPRRRAAPERRPVRVLGLSALGPFGMEVGLLEAAVAGGREVRGEVPPFKLGALLRATVPKEIGRSATYVAAGAALALSDAGVMVRGALRDRTGIFTGATRVPASAESECRESIERRGFSGIAAGPFSRLSVNAPTGTCAKLLSLRGPLLVVAGGRASGLLAIARAAEHLASRPAAELIVAGAADELPPFRIPGTLEGAAFAVLSARPEPSARSVLVERWALAGPARPELAIFRACEGLGEVDAVFAAGGRPGAGGGPPVLDVEASVGGAESAASAFAFVLAVAAVRRGAARRALVVAGGGSLSCAVVVAAEGERGARRGG